MPDDAEAAWVGRHLGTLVGVAGSSGPAGARHGEVFAAWRQFVEALAERRLLVLVFEDLHWADDGLLDFVDYLADWASEVPLLMIGTARPELLARRPGWAGGKPNALTLSLAPLSRDDTARLIGLLSGRPVLAAEQQEALLARADGNPLYTEQYVQMIADQQVARDRPLPVPESVQGIIGARLDLLTREEKRLLHDAAVIGKVFWPGAVATLGGTYTSPDGELDRAGIEECLHGLERKQFIRRDRASSVVGESQFAFTHVLVRDVAYGQIPRTARVSKHIAAAGWIESLGRAEDHAEMLVHHYQNALELARAAGRDAADLQPRARLALQVAGDRTFALHALATAAGFYQAAIALWPDGACRQRARLLRLLGLVLDRAGDLEQAEVVLSEGSKAAAEAGLPAEHARIGVLLANVHMHQGRSLAEALAECEAAIAVLSSVGELDSLAEAWITVSMLRLARGESPADQDAAERAITYARQSGNHRTYTRAVGGLGQTLVMLSMPADAAITRLEQLLPAASGDPWAEAEILTSLSELYAYVGRFADARAGVERARSVYSQSGAKLRRAYTAYAAGQTELIAGDPVAAERCLREAYEEFRAAGERGNVSGITGILAEALYAQGRLAEAQRLTEEAQAATVPDDPDGQARWRFTRAKLLARRGQFPAAHKLADEAETLIAPTSWEALKAEILMAKAEVNWLAGASRAAADCARGALRIYEDQHAVPLAAKARAALVSFAAQPGAKLA